MVFDSVGGRIAGSDFSRHEAPVPRLIVVTRRIPRWIRKSETKPARVLRQPAKCPGLFELGLERRTLGSGHVNRAASVVFAVTGRSAHAQDCVQGHAFGQFGADYFGLAIDASEGRTDLDYDPVGKGPP